MRILGNFADYPLPASFILLFMKRLVSKHLLIGLLYILFGTGSAMAQLTRTEQQSKYQIPISRATTSIKVDGKPDELAWQEASSTDTFWMKWPRDGGPAPAQTYVKCLFDDKYIYISATCQQENGKYIIQSLKRDAGYWDSDGFAIILDPLNNANNGYFFGINASGAQTDAIISAGSDDMDVNWDNAWLSETHKEANQWTFEIAIPLQILRFEEGKTNWGINFIRNDLTNNMYSVWAAIPFEFDGIDLGWAGTLKWNEPPHRAKKNYNFIPYATTAMSKNYEDRTDPVTKLNAGLDAKIGIGSGLNLDVTFNPDFSQTEIDEQVVNLTRFDVQLPEKRTFFLENSDLFANIGIPPIRPFFSRTIGLKDDGSALPIWGGLRLTGNVGPNTRIGVLNMQTREGNDGTPARNYSALAFNRKLFGRTTFTGYYFDRETFQGDKIQKNAFSRNAGGEILYISNDAVWSAWATHHRSFQPSVVGKNWWGNSGFAFKKRRFDFLLDFTHMEENYYADMGFERRIANYNPVLDTSIRIGYSFIFNNANLRFFPKNKDGRLNFTEIGTEIFTVFNPNASLNEFSANAESTWNFKNTSEVSASITANALNLPVPFQISDEDLSLCPPLPIGYYEYYVGNVEWNSDYRKRLTLSASAGGGGYFNGDQIYFSAELGYRIQPVANIRVRAEYNQLNFPAPFCDTKFVNITPRIEVFFLKNLWWTTFLQYNTQSDNFNVNSRLQWRFRPMSDVFLVYTDNYAVKFWGPKNKAFVVKVNYWL